MPSVAALHPLVVHFVVALVLVGIALRWTSVAGRPAWLAPAATTLIALGTLASLVAVRTGSAAAAPLEAVPGIDDALAAHQVWGERARNIFVLLLAADVAAVVLAIRRHPRARAATIAAAAAGVVAVGTLYRAADLGADLVYAYGGGVGIRSGSAEDVHRAFITAAFHQAALDRAAGRRLEAARLADLVAARFPERLELQLAQVEATLVDRGDAQAALSRVNALELPRDDAAARLRAGLLRADALVALGDASAARQVLETLRAEFATHAELQRRLAALPR
jgi:uncharacterized membrane protein